MGNAAWVKSGVSGGVGEMTPLGQDGSGSFRGGGNWGGGDEWTEWVVDSVGRAQVAGLSSVRGHFNGHGVWVAPTRSGFGRLDPLSCCCARPGSGRGGWRGGRAHTCHPSRGLSVLRVSYTCSWDGDGEVWTRLLIVWAWGLPWCTLVYVDGRFWLVSFMISEAEWEGVSSPRDKHPSRTRQ